MNYTQKAREIHEARKSLWIEAGRPRVPRTATPQEWWNRVFVNDEPLGMKMWDDLYLEAVLQELRMRNLGIIK